MPAAQRSHERVGLSGLAVDDQRIVLDLLARADHGLLSPVGRSRFTNVNTDHGAAEAASTAMIDLVSRNLVRIRNACARRGVSFLELVGSAARNDFDPTRSDVDVLVDFPDGAPDLFGSFMGLREDLAEILGRPVDVITIRGVRNPLLLDSLRRDAIRLYAA